MAGRHCRLPDLSLLALAVAHQDPHVPVGSIHPARERHSEADRESLPEGTGGCLDPRCGAEYGMSLQAAVDRTKCLEFLTLEETRLGQRRILDGHAVPFRENEPVATGIGGVRRVVAKYPSEVEPGDQLRGR